jgi:hypothetical protein
MILNSGYLDKNSLQDKVIFLDKEFDLVLDVMRATSREVARRKVCIGVQIDKNCLVSPLMSGYLKATHRLS